MQESNRVGSIDNGLVERRSLEAALADLTASYNLRPRPELARMIQQLEAEIAIRKQTRRGHLGVVAMR